MIAKIKEYFPLDLNTFVGNREAVEYFRAYVEEEEVRNFLIYGLPGVGKTTFAKFLSHELSSDAYYVDLAKNCNTSDYSNLIDILNLTGPRSLVLDNCKFLSQDYFDLFGSYFKDDCNLRTIFVYGTAAEIPDHMYALSSMFELKTVTLDEVHIYLQFILETEGWVLSEEIIKDIVYRSKGYIQRLFNILQDIVVLNLFEDSKYFKHFAPRLDQYFEDLIYYIRDKKRVAKIIEYLLTRMTTRDIYKSFSEYCLFFYNQADSDVYKKLGNRLLIYAKEMERLSKTSSTVTELYCDLYLLETFVADNPEYKSLVDMSLVLPETERERRQAHVIKLAEKPKKEENTKSSVKYLTAEDLAKKIGAELA